MSERNPHTAPSSSQHILRPAAVLEQFSYVRTELGLDTCVVVAARYEHASGHPLDRDTLFAALEHVVNGHPALASRLASSSASASSSPGKGKGSRPRPRTWVLLQSIALGEVVHFHKSGSMETLASVMEAEFSALFDLDAERPLWRLTVLPDGTVVFAFEHAVGDGQSGLAFHLHLLDALQTVKRNPPSPHSGSITVRQADVSLVKPLEDLVDLSAPLTKIVGTIFEAVNPFARKKRHSTWTGHPVPAAPSLTPVRVRVLHLSTQESTRIVQRCRANHATVTGALYALSAHVLSSVLNPKGAKPEYTSITVEVAVSLRRLTSLPSTVFTNCVSSYVGLHDLPAPAHIPTAYPPLASFPWEDAARFSALLKKEALRSPALIGVLRSIFADNYAAFYRDQLGKKREETLVLSNLGRFPSTPGAPQSQQAQGAAGSWAIRETAFAQGNGTLGAALKLNVTGTPEGGLGVSVTWGEGAVDERVAEDFFAALERGLHELARADPEV